MEKYLDCQSVVISNIKSNGLLLTPSNLQRPTLWLISLSASINNPGYGIDCSFGRFVDYVTFAEDRN